MLPHRYKVASYMRDDVRSYHFNLPIDKMNFTHADAQFRSFNLTMRAESGGSTPAARVTWSTALPPECVTSVRVNFKNNNGVVVATNITTNASQTEVVQTGLRCSTRYKIEVVVSGKPTYDGVPFLQILPSNEVRLFIGGK